MLQVAAKVALDYQGDAWTKRHENETESYGDNGGHVVIASWEDDALEMGRRLLSAQKDLDWMVYDSIRARVQVLDMRGRGPIWGVEENTHTAVNAKLLPAGMQVLAQTKHAGAKLLILDPSSAAFGANENDRAQVRKFMSFLDAWAHENRELCRKVTMSTVT